MPRSNSSQSRVEEIHAKSERIDGQILVICAYGDHDDCNNGADTPRYGRYWCEKHAALVENHKHATFNNTDITQHSDTPTEDCTACNGTGLKRLMTRWQFNRTYYGDPDTHTSSEVTGYQSNHVELAEYIDDNGNTKVELVEKHSNPDSLAGPWELIDTYLGDPETGQHHETTGRKPYHRRLGRYINQHGKTKIEVLNNDEHEQSWQDQKREYKQELAEKTQNKRDAKTTSAAPVGISREEHMKLSALDDAELTYETADGETITVNFD